MPLNISNQKLMLRISGWLLLVIAYGLLIPGLTQPMLSVKGTVEKAELVDIGKDILVTSPNMPRLFKDVADMVVRNIDTHGTILAFDKTQSIIGTAQELYRNSHAFVAVLIVFFSVVIPVAKALILALGHSPLPAPWPARLLAVGNASSKWSMADVFVIGIFVSFLAANGMQENRGLVEFDAQLGAGFYYFVSYCLISILGTQLLALADHQTGQHNATTNSA